MEKLEKMNGLMLVAIRKAMHFNIATICQILDRPISVRTWQKYENNTLNIPDKVIEQVYALAFRYNKIKCSDDTVRFIRTFEEWRELGFKDDVVEWTLHKAVFCSYVIDTLVFTIVDSDGKLPRVQKIDKVLH